MERANWGKKKLKTRGGKPRKKRGEENQKWALKGKSNW